jgi:hypothetical protein
MWASVNLWAVLASAIASMVIGSIWYGPLFGKKFIAEMGMDKWSPEKQAAEKKKMGMSYTLQFLASLAMFYVLAGIIVGFGQTTVSEGMMSAFVMWGGFVVPLKLGESIWGGKMSLFWMGISHMLVTLLVAGAIIGGWN